MRLPDNLVSAALATLRQACCELDAPDLYGPDDSTLVNRRDDPLFRDSWIRHRPFQAAGLRVPHLQQGCLRAAIERGEICPEWEIPPPRTPVNDVDSLRQYLQDHWKHVLQAHDSGLKIEEDVVESMKLVFRNARHTAVWFYLQGKLSESPIDIREPKTMTAVRKYLLRFEGWLREARVEQLSPTSPSGLPPQSPHEIQAISPVPTKVATTTIQGKDVPNTRGLHKADTSPPLTHQFGPLIATRTELGHALRSLGDNEKCDAAQRDLVAAKADHGIVWLRKRAGEKTLDAFVRSETEFDAATERLADFRKRKEAKPLASKRKSVTVSASKRK